MIEFMWRFSLQSGWQTESWSPVAVIHLNKYVEKGCSRGLIRPAVLVANGIDNLQEFNLESPK